MVSGYNLLTMLLMQRAASLLTVLIYDGPSYVGAQPQCGTFYDTRVANFSHMVVDVVGVSRKPEGSIQAAAAMDHYCAAARIAVAQIDGGTSLPFAETVRLSSDIGTQGQSGDDDELLQCEYALCDATVLLFSTVECGKCSR